MLQTFDLLSQAVERHADRIWVLNVGDLKPYEVNTEFYLSFGWNSSRWTKDNLQDFTTGWAEREFDLPASKAAVVSEILANVTRWNNRRKPELLNSTTFSLINYREYVQRCRPHAFCFR